MCIHPVTIAHSASILLGWAELFCFILNTIPPCLSEISPLPFRLYHCTVLGHQLDPFTQHVKTIWVFFLHICLSLDSLVPVQTIFRSPRVSYFLLFWVNSYLHLILVIQVILNLTSCYGFIRLVWLPYIRNSSHKMNMFCLSVFMEVLYQLKLASTCESFSMHFWSLLSLP